MTSQRSQIPWKRALQPLLVSAVIKRLTLTFPAGMESRSVLLRLDGSGQCLHVQPVITADMMQLWPVSTSRG